MNIAVTVATAVKKVLELLVSNEKGRKFLGYVVGIAIFIVLLPGIVLVSFFGVFDTENSGVDLRNEILESIRTCYTEQYPEHTEAFDKIENTFGTLGLADSVLLAQYIYVESSLPEANTDDSFYNRYADCFLNVTDTLPLTDILITEFGITFSENDREIINHTAEEYYISIYKVYSS